MTTATAAQDSFFIEFAFGPNSRRVIGDGRVTLKTRKPLAAAFEFDSDDVEVGVIVSTPRLSINTSTDHLLAMNKPHIVEI